MRKTLISVLAMVLILALALPVFAAGGGTASPQYTNVSDAYVILTLNGTTANCTAKITGLSGASIDADIYLDLVYGTTTTQIASWHRNTIGSLNFFDTATIIPGYTYRLTLDATVTRNGVDEPIYLTIDK